MVLMLPDCARQGTTALVLAAALLLGPPLARAAGVVDHDLHVRITPETGRIAVEDRVTLPGEGAAFSLNRSLAVSSPDAQLDHVHQSGPYRYYRVTPRAETRKVTLRYEGVLAPNDDGSGISTDNVFLDWHSAWFPRFDSLLTFSLSVTLPDGWMSVSQGRRNDQSWIERQPQEEIYLLAAPFHFYRHETPHAEALAYFRRADEGLAKTYLEATGRYLDLYSRLIGDYPYAKFALVENMRETGYGMPSFTLLGPRVIRLPFIPYTSYPHEVLHNWWGNSVYIDLTEGNWAEGLTSYLADHLFAEQEGRAEEYRLSALLKYADYVTTERDFPLREFKARHGEVSQAVGYSKGLMFFHMLRQRLGDDKFLRGLQLFYRTQRFQATRFPQLRAAMESVSGENLARYFEQWINRVGAPALRLTDVKSAKDPEGYRLRATLVQAHAGAAYDLRVPIAVALEGRAQAHEEIIAMNEKRKSIDVHLPARPLRIEIDPRSDVFRRLDPAERPPSLAQLFAAERPLFVLPANAPPELRAAYEGLVKQWSGKEGPSNIVYDRDLASLPGDRAVWLLGWENRFREAVARELPEGGAVSADGALLGGETFPREGHSIVVAVKPRAGAMRALIATDNAQAVSGLARKVPHYDKYSYLVFRGDAPDNIRKGQAKPMESPLVVALVPGTPPAKLAPRPPLTATISDK